MRKHFFYTLIFLYCFSTASFSQDTLNFQHLPKATQLVFKQIAAKHKTGPVNYNAVENDTRKSGIDFSNMPIEDAIMMMFMLISEDARKDMKELLNDMDATRRKKAALRQTEELLKKQLDSLKKETDVLKLQQPKKYRVDSLVTAKNINQKNGQLQQNSQQQKEVSAAETNATTSKSTAEIHLRSAEDALIKAKQIRSRKKSQ